MPSKKKAPAESPSPDPLAGSERDEADREEIPSPLRFPKGRTSTPGSAQAKTTTTTPRKHKATPLEITTTPTTSTKRRKLDASPTPARTAPVRKTGPTVYGSASKKRTPLSKASPASNVPRSTTPSKRGNTTSAKKAVATLVTNTNKALPTPSRGRSGQSGQTKTPRSETKNGESSIMPNFDEAFGPSSSHANAKLGSRETFLTNESMKRAREARNFKYEGDKDAPTLTRSGRVIGATSGRGTGKGKERQVDEYGDIVDAEADTEDEAEGSDPDGDGGDQASVGVGTGGDMEVDEDEEPRYGGMEDMMPDFPDKAGLNNAMTGGETVAQKPLPAYVRAHFVDILHTLIGKSIASNPPPFDEEETNEALNQLSALLKGTVERGEGNSALLVGPRGAGKTRTVARALQLLETSPKSAPIVVKLSGHAQTNDRLAIREMGRQIAEAEGGKLVSGEGDDEAADEDGEEYAPTTLPSHLLALLTAPSPRAIVIILEEFDLFTEHARQALLYCLLDVVQSVKTGPVESTGRGVAVIGVTTRTDTLLLLEKRVKSRFSHRIFRVVSPLAPKMSKEGEDHEHAEAPWQTILKRALVPWSTPLSPPQDAAGPPPKSAKSAKSAKGKAVIVPEKDLIDEDEQTWRGDWNFAVDTLLVEPRIVRYMTRLAGLSSDVRNLYRPFIATIAQMLSSDSDFIMARDVTLDVIAQLEGAGWGLQNTKIRGLPAPALGILIISKHLHYAGREEFNFAQVEEEYLRFARTKLVGSGKTRWAIGVLRNAYDHLLRSGILLPTSSASVRPQFQRVRCTITPHEVVAWFKGEGVNSLGPELGNWGRMMGGHA